RVDVPGVYVFGVVVLAAIFIHREARLARAGAVDVTVAVGLVAGGRRSVLDRGLEVVAADAVDLERYGVSFRGRVRLQSVLDRGGQRVTADLFEQARGGRRGRHADVGDVDRDGHAARIRNGRARRTLDDAGFRGSTEGRLGIGDDVREAPGDRAEVDALRLSRVKDGPVGGRVLHGRVEDRVAELPAGHVLEEVRGGDGQGGAGRVRKVDHLHGDVERASVVRKPQAASEDIHATRIAAADHREERVTAWIRQTTDRCVRRSAHVGPEESGPTRLARDRDHARSAVVGDLRRRGARSRS